MASSVLRSILSEIHSTGWFAIIADEATDVRKCEQMCICIRWVDDSYEEPIGLVKVPKQMLKHCIQLFVMFVYGACFL